MHARRASNQPASDSHSHSHSGYPILLILREGGSSKGEEEGG